jgi:DNA-binding transcriptional ArsR family regulator
MDEPSPILEEAAAPQPGRGGKGRPGQAPESMSRDEAAAAALAILDADFFRALCEPPRLEVLRRLIEIGRADIATVAELLPQDRSVVSRHLQVLERAGIVRATREGRNVFYEIDGPAVLAKFRELLAFTERLVPLCCPGPNTTPNFRRTTP